MNRTAYGVFSIALASLLLELVLIRIFDVLWYPNMAYMIITLAVFSFGLAGVYLSIKPIPKTDKTWMWLSVATLLMALSAIFVHYALNRLPFDYQLLTDPVQTWRMGRNFFLIYVVICAPFFLAGLVLSLVFSHYASQIRKLYFWDLIGAAIGSVLLVPLLPKLGTVGVLYVVAGFALLSSGLFSRNKAWSSFAIVAAVIVTVAPFTWDGIKTFVPHMDKRSFKSLQPYSEGTWWDPISKVDIIDYEAKKEGHTFKWIAYDGGSQTSYYYRFDGDYAKLRSQMPQEAIRHFWAAYLGISHYLKRDQDSEVLVIGSAGGQEIKAALTYGAKHVDGIELVGKVVELGKTRFADYIGNVMTHPNVNAQKGEGRSFLRSTDKKYDIIQINSNHTTSSIAAGSGSMQSAYLQTVEAYKEFFSHLDDEEGMLHINHHVYPRMVATAAQAWKEMGRGNFRDHVVVLELAGHLDNLPTFLIRMRPWKIEEIVEIRRYLKDFHLVVNPFEAHKSFLSDDFFTGDFPKALAATIPYRIMPPTDNKPFFNSLRKSFDTLPQKDAKTFVNSSVSGLMNSQKSTGWPIDVIHLIITAGAAIVFALLFTFVPLLFSNAGKVKWEGKGSFITYFSCLGLGFIIFELVFIQIFMKLIGYPLYAYTTVVFTFLFGAGIGSFASEKLALLEKRRTWLPFVGIVGSTVLLVLSQQLLFDVFLQFDIVVRILVSIIMIFPLAFFLGMPFPLGVLAIQHKPQGTVAWAWAFNGLFTVAGGIFCAIFSVYFGFKATMLVAMLAYLVAYMVYRNLYRSYLQEA
ncbi:MAG: hypothetical protein ACRBHB_10360 [Arenicella sp.]